MYIPRRYEEKDREAIQAFVRENSFGILVTVADGRPVGTHIPMLLSGDGSDLVGHVSRGNDQRHSLVDGAVVLAIFPGPHAYISPRWYTEMNVPTWDYLSVHAYGVIELMEGIELEEALAQMVDFYERGKPRPVSVSEIPSKTYQDDLRGIVGFRIRVTEWQAAAKLSQNRDDQSYKQVISELENSEDASARAVAEAMRKKRTFEP